MQKSHGKKTRVAGQMILANACPEREKVNWEEESILMAKV